MRFHITDQKLGALLLATCAIPTGLSIAPSSAVGQEHNAPRAVVKAATATTGPSQTTVSTASSVRAGASPALRIAQNSGVVMLVQSPSDLQPPQLPAAQGPTLGANASQSTLPLEPATVPVQPADEAEFSENSLMPLQNRGLNNRVQVVDLSVSGLGTGQIPEGAAEQLPVEAAYGRAAVFKCVHWHPSEICHFPLRFEEAMLERHGHVRFGLLQPLASGARFFGTIPMIPYLNTLKPRHQSVYALGNYRPGSSAPLLRDSIPYDSHAAVVEAMAVAGFFWAAPL